MPLLRRVDTLHYGGVQCQGLGSAQCKCLDRPPSLALRNSSTALRAMVPKMTPPLFGKSQSAMIVRRCREFPGNEARSTWSAAATMRLRAMLRGTCDPPCWEIMLAGEGDAALQESQF